MKTRYYGLLCVLGAFSAFPFFAHAATMLSFSVPTGSVAVGDPFPVAVMIDTDQPANAYSIHIGYSAGILDFTGANNADSLINVWEGNPTVEQGGGISWSGGSVAPFSGTHGKLLTLNFIAAATGTAAFSFNGSYVYLANGKGTRIVPQTTSASLQVAPVAPGVHAPVERSDAAPPTISFLALIPDPFNADQKMLGFQTTDPGSGIKETDMRYRSGFFWSEWRSIKNPAPLANAVWEVGFKAVDNAGNAAETTLYDWGAFCIFLLKDASAAVFIALIFFLVLRRSKW